MKQSDPTQGDAAGDPAHEPSEFVAPQDLIGSDLAAQLQEVLDEASSHLSGEASVTIGTGEPEPRGDDGGDSGTFESPAEVLAAEAVSTTQPMAAAPEQALDEPAVVEAEPEGVSFEEQLRELMALASGKKPAAPVEAPIATPAAVPASSTAQAIDQTTVQAQAVTAELDQLNSIIQAAVAAGDEPAEARVESVKQLDEILAGHADHAVADEFETVNDVIALEKALAELTTEPVAAGPRFAAPQQEVAPADPGIRYGGDTSLAPAPAAVAPAPAASDPPVAPATPAPAFTTPATANVPAAAATEHRTGPIRDKLLRICITLNRPLRNASPATRNLIGYAGLLTVANGMFLILLKLLRG